MPRKIIVAGDARECGYQHGTQAADLIRKGVEFYVDIWESSTGRSRDELLEVSGGFAEPIANFDAAIFSELEGIAAGSGLSLAEVLVLNARYELMLATVFADDPARLAECTSLGAAPDATENGHTLVGQNWDWAVPVGEVSILLEVQQRDRPDILTHVEAGFVGHKGINSHGLALCVNAMGSQLDSFSAAVPAWVLARSALNCATIGEARETVSRAERVASLNFTMAARNGEVASLEVTPVDVALVDARAGRATHGNVFADTRPDRGIQDRLAALYPAFCDRAARAAGLMEDGAASVERLKDVLRDHENRPESICRHREDQPEDLLFETLASVVMDVTAGTLEIADGPPCKNEYSRHTLSRS